ncbi:MAG: twin-arginine translocase TatA/TatE family subunit [Rhodothermaceae bacterium]|nr:twin-arginine translocase TatA/TatE family subunit [Rhodothermaceae bacterium]MXW33948.1 twin-arginine translocase TatA/TatE family subunit [Rhodothermaceae bacterium]MXX98062.1 twin-arginine translocase TatA/TatE family subunit [Rhodothermaceae bacterium]MXZ16809.1 twin-arginine translocase TatA/TatE family subunit [Rhodothermaceae bacterium]MXZ57699.1 twin-arginine translocase TatA/TatE family subunit [Rhodothermaceae bacterium]
MFGLGPMEIAIILLIVLVLFGAKRIPEVARGLGKGIREFKSATSEISRELTVEDRPPAYRPPAQQNPPGYVPPSQEQEPATANPTPEPSK